MKGVGRAVGGGVGGDLRSKPVAKCKRPGCSFSRFALYIYALDMRCRCAVAVPVHYSSLDCNYHD